MNPNPSGLDPTARSFTGQYSQTQNPGNVYHMGSNLSLQQLQSGLQPQLGARGFGTMPVSGSQTTDRFQSSFTQQLNPYQQTQSRHPGLALGSYPSNPNVRGQFGSQLGLQNSQGLGNRPLMNASMSVPGFGSVTQNPQGVQGMPQWSGGQQSIAASNLHSLTSMNRMQGLNQQQLNQVRLGQTMGRDINAATLSGFLQQQQQQQQQQQSLNPSHDLLSMMKYGRGQQQGSYGLMPQMSQLQSTSTAGGFVGGRSALPLERPGEQGMNAAMSNLRFDASEFPSLSGVNATASLGNRMNAIGLTYPTELDVEKSVIGKEEYPTLSTAADQTVKASVHGPIGRTQPIPPVTSEPVSTDRPASTSQTYFHANHNMPSAVQDSLKNLQIGRSSKSPPPSLRTPPTSTFASLLPTPPQQPAASPDRFSLLGLRSVIKMVDEDLSMLALGQDLTVLGLKVDDGGNELYKTFSSPWTYHQSPGSKPDVEIPACYKNMAEKLSPEHLAKFKDDTLFFVFYSSPGEEAQAMASTVLASRGLTWHKDRKQWFMRVPNMQPQKMHEGERGSYIFFDTLKWKYVQKDNFLIKYEAVESGTTLSRVQLPMAMK